MLHKSKKLLAPLLLLAATACSSESPQQDLPANSPGFQALGPQEASSFELPRDARLSQVFEMPGRGKRYERYQQYFGDAKVLGAQITLHRNSDSDRPELVLGRHFDHLSPDNYVALGEREIEELAEAHAKGADYVTELMLDPESNRFFYRVESRGELQRYVMWFDAQSGELINEYDGLASADMSNCSPTTPAGIGFDGTVYDLTGLTTNDSLETSRQKTYDLGSWKKPFYGTAHEDADGCYDTAGRTSPGQGAVVSAHVHVKMADDYFLSRGFDLVSAGGLDGVTVWAHKDKNYVNAYWDGTKMVFGDGNGTTYRELVALDIAAHELAHGVTDFTSDLIYQNESGALNESFSDIMGAVVEFNNGPGDWLMGEDSTTDGLGLRSMSDPTLHGDPGHWCDRYTGTGDNGGVHINSGISNKAFYLLATDAVVGLDLATDIFYDAYTGLSASATFLDARAATVAAAPADFTANVEAVWDAVGVSSTVDCGTEPPPEPECTLDADCADDGDSCTVATCDNGTCTQVAIPDCGGTCSAPNAACNSDDDCCSGNCRTKGKKANTCS